jgi:hypothetical protein
MTGDRIGSRKISSSSERRSASSNPWRSQSRVKEGNRTNLGHFSGSKGSNLPHSLFRLSKPSLTYVYTTEWYVRQDAVCRACNWTRGVGRKASASSACSPVAGSDVRKPHAKRGGVLFARFWDSERPGKPRRLPARTEPRSPGIIEAHLATTVPGLRLRHWSGWPVSRHQFANLFCRQLPRNHADV